MKTTFFSRALILLLFVPTVAVFRACSKSDETTAPSLPTATPTATATPVSTTTPTASPSPTPAPTASPFADVNLRLRDLETRMETIFADTFRNVGNWFEQSTLALSVDVREQNDKYIARLYVPHGDTAKIDAKIDNGSLHITGRAERTVDGKAVPQRYEQVINLPKTVRADKMQVDRKGNLVVITIPKTLPSAPVIASRSPAPVPAGSPGAGPADWEATMSNQIASMQARIDQAIHDVFQNDPLTGASALHLGSAMNVDDQKDKYVVHFYLPNRNVSDVNVKFEKGQLHLTADASSKTGAGTVQTTSAARYEELITLPGPVKESEMEVERKTGAVVVTLPKG
jgi:HSP20 family molecular chaperone IbpA